MSIVNYASRCSWPPLSEPFATALRHAVDFIFAELEPVGVVATGTIVRGRPNRSSDLDLCVVHAAAHRRRIQRYFDGVPAEIFVNPPAAIRGYFADEDRDGRRVTAHMFATGVVIFDADPVLEELRTEAAQWLGKETRPSEFESVSARYTIASRLEDALDVLGSDDATADLLMRAAVLDMLEYLCKTAHGRIPRRKDLLAQLAKDHPMVATLAAAFLRANDVTERARLAGEIADTTIGARGFFEWDSGPGPVPN